MLLLINQIESREQKKQHSSRDISKRGPAFVTRGGGGVSLSQPDFDNHPSPYTTTLFSVREGVKNKIIKSNWNLPFGMVGGSPEG